MIYSISKFMLTVPHSYINAYFWDLRDDTFVVLSKLIRKYKCIIKNTSSTSLFVFFFFFTEESNKGLMPYCFFRKNHALIEINDTVKTIGAK